MGNTGRGLNDGADPSLFGPDLGGPISSAQHGVHRGTGSHRPAVSSSPAPLADPWDSTRADYPAELSEEPAPDVNYHVEPLSAAPRARELQAWQSAHSQTQRA